MPNEFDQNAVSSMTSVLSSIEHDRQTYQWFLMLMTLSDIQKDLCGNTAIKQEYQALKKIQIAEILAYLSLALIMAVSCFLKQPLGMLTGAVPLIVLCRLFRKNRSCVARISREFLVKHILPQELKKQTLYQTCEYLSKQYKIPSLVDVIAGQDFVGRKVILGAVLFIPFICPFKNYQILIATVIVYFATIAALNTSVVVRKLK